MRQWHDIIPKSNSQSIEASNPLTPLIDMDSTCPIQGK
ncbi:hypothetical protein PMIT1342_00877 [Prochlorococcus marinus str. MIT 1342]|nr:hypothetical protein PMIT1342_00877 [Prochlorococcus marinus str. MIT 1342]